MVHSISKTNVEVVVKLATTLASDATTRQRLRASAAELGIQLEPLDPSQTNPELATYHTARVPADTAADAVNRLRQCDGIEAVYIKPQGETPSGGTT